MWEINLDYPIWNRVRYRIACLPRLLRYRFENSLHYLLNQVVIVLFITTYKHFRNPQKLSTPTLWIYLVISDKRNSNCIILTPNVCMAHAEWNSGYNLPMVVPILLQYKSHSLESNVGDHLIQLLDAWYLTLCRNSCIHFQDLWNSYYPTLLLAGSYNRKTSMYIYSRLRCIFVINHRRGWFSFSRCETPKNMGK